MDTRDWSLCFICQSDKNNEKALCPSSSIRLRNNTEQLCACYKEVVENILELKALGELTDFVAYDICAGDIGGVDDSTLVQLMISQRVLWHKSCRNAIDNQKVQRARKKHEESVSPVKTRRMMSGGRSTTEAAPSQSSSSKDTVVNTPCFFCGEVGNRSELRKAATLGLDTKVRECVEVLGDKHLLGQLSAGDMVAIDAIYHCACLTRLYRKAATVECDMTENHATQVIRAHVLNEL